MKKLSKETAFNLRTGFGTLVSNQSCIEAGKSLPWWIAIIIGLIATFIPVIPVMTNISRTNGDSFINGTYNYSFDKNATIANVLMNNEGIEFTVGEDHYLTYTKNGEVQTPSRGDTLLASYTNQISKQYDIRAYWLTDFEDKTVNDFYKEITSVKYVLGTTTPRQDSDPEGTKYYIPNYLFYYKEGNGLYLAKVDSDAAASRFTGDFINVPAGTKLVNRMLTVTGKDIPTDINKIDSVYIEGVFNNYKDFYNESYLDIKSKSLVYSTVIYWGIYLGLTLFLGLLIFLLTRGKRNFNNYLKWWQCLSIAGWASFTPGVLAMILGFLMTNYAIMFFILLMGVRTMWLSMKQLSPNYQAQR